MLSAVQLRRDGPSFVSNRNISLDLLSLFLWTTRVVSHLTKLWRVILSEQTFDLILNYDLFFFAQLCTSDLKSDWIAFKSCTGSHHNHIYEIHLNMFLAVALVLVLHQSMWRLETIINVITVTIFISPHRQSEPYWATMVSYTAAWWRHFSVAVLTYITLDITASHLKPKLKPNLTPPQWLRGMRSSLPCTHSSVGVTPLTNVRLWMAEKPTARSLQTWELPRGARPSTSFNPRTVLQEVTEKWCLLWCDMTHTQKNVLLCTLQCLIFTDIDG